jgi:hypothetical protein
MGVLSVQGIHLGPYPSDNRATATPLGDPIGLGFLRGGSCAVTWVSEGKEAFCPS